MRRCSWQPVNSFLARMRMKSLRLNEDLLYCGPHDDFQVALETLEGHQRAIMGSMTVEEIYRDRKKFSKAVFEVASSDLGEERNLEHGIGHSASCIEEKLLNKLNFYIFFSASVSMHNLCCHIPSSAVF